MHRPEILRFAQNDTIDRAFPPEILRFAQNDIIDRAFPLKWPMTSRKVGGSQSWWATKTLRWWLSQRHHARPQPGCGDVVTFDATMAVPGEDLEVVVVRR